ncbi:MAG: hypothetical protein ABR878_09535 [Roseiarcus sp.]
MLGEPTAALDSESEREAQKAPDDLLMGRTTVVVAHRVQTIVVADRINVVEEGRTVDSGSRREVVARGGPYCAVFAAQFGAGAPLKNSRDWPPMAGSCDIGCAPRRPL